MMLALAVTSVVLAQAPATVFRTLENGVQLIVQRMYGTPVFSAQTFIRSGAAYETSETSGINHILEHMAFRGSEGIASGELDMLAETSGAYLNATSYREAIRYFCDGPNESWSEGARAVAKLIQEPALDSNQLKSELMVMEEEHALLRLDPLRVMNAELWKAAYGNHPRSLPSMGDPDLMRKLSADLLRDYHKKHYVGVNIVAVLIGDFDKDEGVKLMEELYRDLPRGRRAEAPEYPEFMTGRHVKRAPFGKEFIGFGFETPGLNRMNELAAWELVIQILGGDFGRSAQASVPADVYYGPSVSGSLLTLVFNELRGVENLEAAATGVLNKLSEGGVTEQELADAKRRMRSRYPSCDASATDTGFLYGLHMLLAGGLFISVMDHAIESVTLHDVNKAAKALAPEMGVTIYWRKS